MKFKKLKSIIRTSPLRNSRIYHFCRYFLRRKAAVVVAKQYLNTDTVSKKTLAAMRTAMVRYHWDFSEFFMYNFETLSDAERRTFIPEYEKNIFCDRVNDYNKSKIFDSKYNTYLNFKDYYKRDVILLSSEKDLYGAEFAEFVGKHKRFIVKPDSDASGRGINVMAVDDKMDAASKIIQAYSTTFSNLVLEELISQNHEMAKYHPTSVNTLRIRSFRFDDRVEILPCNMRIGKGGSVVDNTGQGGISAYLDSNGYIALACDEAGNNYNLHPDTGVQIINQRVPQWEEALQMVRELAYIVPEVRYVGWDIAYTDEGWVLIEGNDKGMFVGIQKTTQKGFRPEVDRILGELNLKL